jgi:predicted nucleic acid-binding Zn ribbon protein
MGTSEESPDIHPHEDHAFGSNAAARIDWIPDGEDLARALVARAKAAGHRGGSLTLRPSNPRGRGRVSRSVSGSGWSGPAGDDRDPQTLGKVVDKLVGEHGWDEDLAVHGVVARWDRVVGSDLAAHVRPERYVDGVLTLRAESTAWATQVRLLAVELIQKLNHAIGAGTVTRVDVVGPQAPSWRKGPRSVRGRGPRDTYG